MVMVLFIVINMERVIRVVCGLLRAKKLVDGMLKSFFISFPFFLLVVVVFMR